MIKKSRILLFFELGFILTPSLNPVKKRALCVEAGVPGNGVPLFVPNGKGITEINEKGPVFEGKQYELDVLIYATGFEVQKTGIYNQIKGEHGLDIAGPKIWENCPA